MLELTSRSAEETRSIGEVLGRFLKPGDLIALQGDLGAGKTTLVQGLAAGWGSQDQVTSPTFVLVNVYQKKGREGRSLRRPQLYHLDAYRLSGPQEAADLDLDLYLETGPMVVEWFERIQDALPRTFFQVRLAWLGDQARSLSLTAAGPRYEALLLQVEGVLAAETATPDGAQAGG